MSEKLSPMQKSLEKERQETIYNQAKYLNGLAESVIEKAGEKSSMAEMALNRVFVALAYNGSEHLEKARLLVINAGKLLEEELPESGRALTILGQATFGESRFRISTIAISRFLESRGVETTSVIPDKDLPFYSLIGQGGFSLEDTRSEIGKWLFDSPGFQSEKSPKERALEKLERPWIKNEFQRMVRRIIIGKEIPTDEELAEISAAVDEALKEGIEIEDIYTVLLNRPKKKV